MVLFFKVISTICSFSVPSKISSKTSIDTHNFDPGHSSNPRKMSSSSRQIKTRYQDEVNLFGPPFAYYKDNRHGPSLKLFLAGFLITIVCILDFLLATNIIIYVRTLNPDSTSEIFVHSAIVILSAFLIWFSYRFMCWYVKKFQIKDTLKENKLYKKIANDVIELENLLSTEHTDKRDE